MLDAMDNDTDTNALILVVSLYSNAHITKQVL